MRTMLKVLRQEAFWVALNVAGVVYYLVRTWGFATPDAMMGYNIDKVIAVLQIWGVFLLLNVIWIVALLRRRRTPRSFLVVLAMGILWFGSYLFLCARIDDAVKGFYP